MKVTTYVKEFETAQELEDWLKNETDTSVLMNTGEGHSVSQYGVRGKVYYVVGFVRDDKMTMAELSKSSSHPA